MAADTQGPSPQDLATLENAFSSEPGGDAYGPLAKAYLSLARYMEAMVVCKKGVKAHPEDPGARVLLANIYAAQGKDKKAKVELKGALSVDANSLVANRMLGGLLLKEGELESGAEHLKRAAEQDPTDEETLSALQKWGIDFTPPAPPEPPPPVAPPPAPPADMQPQPPRSATSAAPLLVRTAGPPQGPEPVASSGAPVLSRAAPVPAPGAPLSVGAPSPAGPAAAHPRPVPVPGSGAPRPASVALPPISTSAPIPRPAAAGHSPVATSARLADADVDYRQYDKTPPKRSSKAGLLGTMAMLIIGVIGLGGYGYWYAQEAQRARDISKLLKQAQENLSQDSYASYRAASGTLDKILDLDSDQFAAHAYLAYINILRWGLHGEGDTYRQRGLEHLKKAEAEGRDHSHLIAARAYERFFGGDQSGAIKELETFLNQQDVSSGLLSGALGALEMWAGDLDAAQKWLAKANQYSAGDPHILATLGELAYRRGLPSRAWKYYDQALRFDSAHVESLLGKALIILDEDRMDPATADSLIKKVEDMDNTMVSPRQRALAHFARAQLLFAQSKTKEAEAEQEQALMLQPNNPDIEMMRGRRLFRAGSMKDAERAMRKAIEIDPKRARFYVELARVLLATKQGAKEAVEALTTARKAMPENAQLVILLGDAHAAIGAKKEALGNYAEAIKMNGGSYPQAQLSIGKLHRKSKDYDQAITELTKAFGEFKKAVRPRGQAEACLEIARTYLAKRDFDPAKEWLTKAQKSDSSYADPYYFIGRMLAGTRATRGDARTALRTYLKLAPTGNFATAAKRQLTRL